eukprot:4546516-Pyramimonas_sp.AAC.1
MGTKKDPHTNQVRLVLDLSHSGPKHSGTLHNFVPTPARWSAVALRTTNRDGERPATMSSYAP